MRTTLSPTNESDHTVIQPEHKESGPLNMNETVYSFLSVQAGLFTLIPTEDSPQFVWSPTHL